jgi:hypothetical protein
VSKRACFESYSRASERVRNEMASGRDVRRFWVVRGFGSIRAVIFTNCYLLFNSWIA